MPMSGSASMSMVPYEYAIVRIVPRVERGEQVNAGVVLFCRQRRFLGARMGLDSHHQAALTALAPSLALDSIQERLDVMARVAAGGPESGPIGALSEAERFRWLAAPSSTMVQPSPVHAGRCDDPERELEQLYRTTVAAVG